MNTTSLYTAVCRLTLLADPCDSSSWSEIATLMPYLRRSLSCCACGLLVQDSVVSPVCGHNYCQGCQEDGKEPVLRITCKHCKERRGLQPDNHVRLLSDCYKTVCDILSGYPAAQMLPGQNGGRGILAELLEETCGNIPLASFSILPRTNFPPFDVQKDVERKRKELVNEVAEDRQAMSTIVAQLSAGLARKGVCSSTPPPVPPASNSAAPWKSKAEKVAMYKKLPSKAKKGRDLRSKRKVKGFR